MRLVVRIAFWLMVALFMLLATVLPDETMIWVSISLAMAAASEAVIRADQMSRGLITSEQISIPPKLIATIGKSHRAVVRILRLLIGKHCG